MRLLAKAADVVVVALIAAALAIAWTGGGRVELGALRLSAGSWLRPAVAALLLFAAAQWPRRRTADVANQAAAMLPAALVVAALIVSATYVVHACGGLDSHGYVAFSELLSHGRLSMPLPELSWLPARDLAALAAPLGFIPSDGGATLVPEFPAGLPVLMAAARLLAGPDAVFWVPWTCHVALVVTVFLFSRHHYGALAASVAAALMALHPVAMTSAIQPMSDVPATLMTMLAVAGATHRDRPRLVAAGLAGSLAMLIRPPLLLPLAVLCAAQVRRAPRHGFRLAVALAPGLLALLTLQFLMFGNPLVSGHGGAGALFGLDAAAHNLAAQAKWLMVVHTPLFFAALWLGWQANRPLAAVLFAVAAGVALPYVFYRVRFDDWEMLRFLLPGIALLLPVAGAGVARVLQPLRVPAVRQLAVAALALVMVIATSRWLGSHGILTLSQGEAKYPRVGAWFAQRTPGNAVVLASLHSGSVHYYSGRQTLRWDVLPPDQLAATVAAATTRGVPIYTALDSYEVAEFEQRFASDLERAVVLEPLDRVATIYLSALRPK